MRWADRIARPADHRIHHRDGARKAVATDPTPSSNPAARTNPCLLWLPSLALEGGVAPRNWGQERRSKKTDEREKTKGWM